MTAPSGSRASTISESRMTTSLSFSDVPVLGRMSAADAAVKLREIGEDEEASRLEAAQRETARGGEAFAMRDLFPFGDRAWKGTAHAFGYIAPAKPGKDLLPIMHAGNIEGEPALKNSRIRIVLNRLRVADYPGGGTHRVLFDFYAQNQLPGSVEHVHFNTTLRVREGQEAAVIGYPIFVGLNVGSEGVAFQCLTVNVRNDGDEAFLNVLESDVFRGGLKLAMTAQPAIAPLTQIALGLTKSIAMRNRNVAVQEFSMGLDFTNNVAGARLATGDYIAVQIPESLEVIWDWEEWVYQPKSGHIVRADDLRTLIPHNYLVFGISPYDGP